ncbi:MAG: YabP/YqfC family sporulation protein [Clostridia bacterium]|nr:YabP/YqfC family sporulation protein [Clostridia bacterium]
MAKNEQHSAKNDKKTNFSLWENDLFCGESILLRGNHSAVLYGCEKILFYEQERICFSMRERAVSVFGRALCCTVFSPSGVTVEGEISGVCYCYADCLKNCPYAVQGEGKV